MLMLMVPEMLRGGAGLVLTVGACHSPPDLQRQQHQEEDGDQALHGGDYSGVRRLAGAIQLVQTALLFGTQLQRYLPGTPGAVDDVVWLR